MHQTIQTFHDLVLAHEHSGVPALMATDIKIQPPTYWATWHRCEAVATMLAHVSEVFTDFEYRHVTGSSTDWALEFQCEIDGLMQSFEVVMRPYKTIGALRVAKDPAFLKHKSALS